MANSFGKWMGEGRVVKEFEFEEYRVGWLVVGGHTGAISRVGDTRA